jgi:uncharacterized protein (DUF736 family)
MARSDLMYIFTPKKIFVPLPNFRILDQKHGVPASWKEMQSDEERVAVLKA